MAERPDGRRTALDARALYRERYAAEAVFQATLRRELATRLGLVFDDMDRHGVAEMAGISAEMRRAFSRRRAEIVAEMERLGTTPATAPAWRRCRREAQALRDHRSGTARRVAPAGRRSPA